MAKITPPLLAKGRYTVRAPFEVKETSIYTCIALRKFEDIVELGEDVYQTYYQPFGLTTAVYQLDVRAGAVIVTLQDPYGEVLYIPDTYILTYPNMGDITYHHVVVSVSLGPLPTTVPLDYLKQQMASIASDVTGVDAIVREHIAPTIGAVTPTQHEILEAARVLRVTNRETDRAKVLAAAARTQLLEERIRVLEEVIREAGLV